MTEPQPAQKSDRTNGRLDAAVVAHRDHPTETTRTELFAAMEQHNEAFLRDQTVEFIERTTRSKGCT